MFSAFVTELSVCSSKTRTGQDVTDGDSQLSLIPRVFAECPLTRATLSPAEDGQPESKHTPEGRCHPRRGATPSHGWWKGTSALGHKGRAGDAALGAGRALRELGSRTRER